MQKLGKPMFAALLAVAGSILLAGSANAEAQSKGTYFIRTIDQPAVISAPVVRTQSAVVAPAACGAVIQSELPAATTTTIVQQPIVEQTLVQSAVMLPATGFSMDPTALRLYTGPRFENTLTMPDAATFLRP